MDVMKLSGFGSIVRCFKLPEVCVTTAITLSDAFVKELVSRHPDHQDYLHAQQQAVHQTRSMFDTLMGAKDNRQLWDAKQQLVQQLAGSVPSLIDWEAKANNNLSALNVACFAAEPALVRLLIGRGHDVNQWAPNSALPITNLVMALSASHATADLQKEKAKECVRILLEAGANTKPYNNSPIHFAQEIDMVALLLEHGANPMDRTSLGNGGTALHNAADRGDDEKAALLIDAGAVLSAENESGLTAYQVATERASRSREDKLDGMSSQRRAQAEAKEFAYNQIRRLIADRIYQAEQLYESFRLDTDFRHLPPHALIFFSNLGVLDDVMSQPVPKGQEAAVLEQLVTLPKWLRQQYEPAITDLMSRGFEPEQASWAARMRTSEHDVGRGVGR